MNIELIHGLWVAAALMLIVEGIMPFLNPTVFRRALLQMASMSDQTLRTIGLASMILGLIFLYWIN